MRLPLSVLAFGFVAYACGGSGGISLDGDAGLDAASDGNASDGPNQNPDAPSDSPTSGDGATCPDFCASVSGTPTFCSDFDSESSPADWTETVSMGGTVAIEQTQDVSCPNGLEVTLPKISNVTFQSIADAKLSKTVTNGSPVTHAHVELDAYLPANDTVSYVSYFGLRSSTDIGSGVYVTHHGDAFWFISQLGGALNIPIPTAPLTGAWNHMSLDVVFGSQATDSVTFDYTGSDNMPHSVACTGAACCGGGTCAGVTSKNPVTSTLVEVGMESSGPVEAAFAAYYDNVVLRVGN